MTTNTAIPGAFAEIYERDVTTVLRFLRKRCPDDALAEDLTSEVFAAAARRVASGGDVSTPWLLTVARRRLVDHWRRVERQQRLADRLKLERVQCDLDFEPGDPAVRRAVAALPETQQRALILRYVTCLSVSQVAGVLSLSYQATESLLARGRRGFAANYSG